tara:strand:+ start:14196 stop:15341 length:1146 start_codon:yes stop_codon:yes gene_type:complete
MVAVPLPGVLIVIAVCANAIPFFYGQTLFDAPAVTAAARPFQYLAIGALLMATCLAILQGRAAIDTRSNMSWAIGVMTIYLMFNSLVSDLPQVSTLYSLIFGTVAYAITVIRLRPDAWERVFKCLSAASLAMLFVFVMVKDREGRWYGAVHPNFLGGWLIVQASLIQVWRGKIKWLGTAALLVIVILVDSRFSFLAILILIFSTELLRRLNSPSRLMIFGLVCGLALLIVGGYIWSILIGEGARSAAGGISGRTERWETAFSRIAEHPFFGTGFRTSREEFLTAHSGIITLWEELGIFGAVGFLSLFFSRMAMLFRLSMTSGDMATRRLAIVFLGTLLAYTSPLVFQPNYMNFGDPIGILILLYLFTSLPTGKHRNRSRIE